MIVAVKMKMEIDDEYYDELKSIVDHKIEYLVDMDANPEINSIFEAEVNEVDD